MQTIHNKHENLGKYFGYLKTTEKDFGVTEDLYTGDEIEHLVAENSNPEYLSVSLAEVDYLDWL